MTVYIDDADETEEGEFVRHDRTYHLFRMIAESSVVVRVVHACHL